VESRFELNHGTFYPHLETEFRREDGSRVKTTLVQAGDPPSSSETYDATQRPDGAWRVTSRGARVSLVARFRKDQASRCRIYWRARGENRVLVSLYTERCALAPGQKVTLEAHYSIEAAAV
jgi:hypothetical protein